MSSSAAAPTRLMNTQINPYWGMVDKNTPASAVYIHGQDLPPGLEGGIPTWVPIEFPAVAAYDTQDATINLPGDFTLLSFLASASQAEGFAVQVYDVESQLWLTDKQLSSVLIAGNGKSPLIERVPHTFAPDTAQIFVRAINQSPNQNDIMFALYGMVGGAKE